MGYRVWVCIDRAHTTPPPGDVPPVCVVGAAGWVEFEGVVINTVTGRIICQFSCGAASAVATKLVLTQYPAAEIIILNAFIAEEHPDNRRFLADCEIWFNAPITVVRNSKYNASTHEVWKRNRYMIGEHGAPCSRALKRQLLAAFAKPDDIFVLGYTADEAKRFDAFLDANNGRRAWAPLIEYGLRKADVLAVVERAGLMLPEMYRLGFNNANCIGCPKGGMGYWNHVRKVFPEKFYQIAGIQETIGPGAYFFRNRETKERFGLLALPLDAGVHDEPTIECSFWCEAVEAEITEGERAL